MQKKTITSLIFLFATAVFAQHSTVVNYIESTDVFDRDVDKYKGKSFLFYNILQYDSDNYEPPYPYSDGRVRNGKYKASQTAMDNYIKSLSKYNGKRFSLVELANEEEDMPGLVMACENGDTLLFNANIVDAQFINEAHLNEEKKDIGITAYYINHRSNRQLVADKIKEDHAQAVRSGYNHFYGFTEVRSGKTFYYLPYLSKWKITDVSYDTTFVGKRNVTNNEINAKRFNRIKYTIENPNYGKYEFHLSNINNLNTAAMVKDSIAKLKECEKVKDVFKQSCLEDVPDANGWPYVLTTSIDHARSFSGRYTGEQFVVRNMEFPEEDQAIIKEWASKGYVEAMYAKAVGIDKETCRLDECSPKIIECAKKGFPIAINYIAKETDAPVSQNWSTTDEKLAMIKKAWQIYGKSQKLDKIFDQIMLNTRTKKDYIEIYKEAGKYGYANAKSKISQEKYFEAENKKSDDLDAVKKEITEENIKKNGFEKILKKVQSLQNKYAKDEKVAYDIDRMYKQILELYSKILFEPILKDPKKSNDKKEYKPFYNTLLNAYKTAKKYGYTRADSDIKKIEESLQLIDNESSRQQNRNKDVIDNLNEYKNQLLQEKKSLLQQNTAQAKAQANRIDSQIEQIDQRIKKMQK